MKKAKTVSLLLAGILLSGALVATRAQNAQQVRYGELVVDNPNAEADMAVVGAYVNALIGGDLEKAKALLAPGFRGYGPSPADSVTAESVMAEWRENYKTHSDRKVSFVTQTFRVTAGNLQGDWVSMWGDYVFTISGKTISLPYQMTARVKNGKIDTERIYYDRMYIMQQLGYTLTPPNQ